MNRSYAVHHAPTSFGASVPRHRQVIGFLAAFPARHDHDRHGGFTRPKMLHRLEAIPLGHEKVGDQHVGGAGRAFVFQPFDQRIFTGLDAVQFDAGGLGEIAVQRFVGLVMP